MWRAGLTVWGTIESGRIIGTLLTVFLQKTIMRSLFSRYVREDTIALGSPQTLSTCPGSEHEHNLPSRDGLRFTGGEALSAVVRDCTVNNGAAIDTFPCIEHEKEIGEPFQHHHTLALRTFH